MKQLNIANSSDLANKLDIGFSMFQLQKLRNAFAGTKIMNYS